MRSTLLIAFLAAVVVAQPLVNAPVFPRYNYLTEGMDSLLANGATAEATTSVGNWVFGATSKGFYAMNGSMASSTDPMPGFFDALNGSTANLIWTLSESRVLVVAESMLLMYGYNSTMVWRVAMYKIMNATFNLKDHSAIPHYTNPYPLYANDMIILGTLNTTNVAGYPVSSNIYAFSPVDLSMQWMSNVPYYRTNYPGTTVNGSAMAWFAGRTGLGNVHLLNVWLKNGTVSQTVDTQTSDFLIIQQAGDVVAISSRDDTVAFYGATNGSLLHTFDTTYTCYNVRFPPGLLNVTWFSQCDGNVYMFSTNPIKYVGMVHSSNDFTAGAVQAWNQDILLFASDSVYLVNISRASTKLITFNLTRSNSITPVAATFNPSWWHLPQMSSTICIVSYTSYIGGSVIGYDYMTNTVVAQLVGSLSPYGRAWLFPTTADGGMTYDWRVFTASQSAEFLQGYDVVHTNISFVAEIDDSEGLTDFPSVTEMNSSTTYVFTTGNLYIVDAQGNVGSAIALPTSNYLETSTPPFIAGDYVCIIQTYFSDDDSVHCYNMMTGAWKVLSMCQPLTGTLPWVMYNTIMITCNSNFDTAIAIADVTGTTSNKYPGDFSYRRGATLLGNLAIAQTSYSTLSAFDITSSSTTAKWTVSSTSWTYVYSNAVTDGTYVYVVGFAKVTPGVIPNTHQSLFKISMAGSIVSQMYLPFIADVVRLRLMKGPNFGPAGVVYMFGGQNITAVDIGTMTTMFWVSSNTTIVFTNLGAGTVLPSGAVCFYGADGYFHVHSGFNGAMAWMREVSAAQGLQITGWNTSVYYSTGRTIVAADMYTGAEHGAVGFGTIFTPASYSLAVGMNNTVSIITAGNRIVVAAGTNYYPYAAAGFSGGAPANNGGSGSSTTSDKKTVIIVVVVVVVVVLIAVVVVALKSRKSDTNEDYVPMNPAAQV